MGAIGDLIDVELLLRARSEGMGAFNEAGGGLGGLAKGFLAVGAVVATVAAAAIATSVDMAAKFQRDLTLIHTQAGDTSADLKKIGTDLEALAPQVGYGPDELAKAMYHVESAGFRGAQALDMVRQAAELAQVGGADLESTTQAVIGTLSAFGDQGMTASNAVAILNATVGAGDMRMQQLTDALATGILPAARVAHVGLLDIGAAVATMTDNVTPANEAATRLRMTLSQLDAPTKSAQKALASIGIGADDLQKDLHKPNGLLLAVEDLKNHLDEAGKHGVNTADVIARAFGGGRSSAGIETLLSEFDRFKDKYKAIEDGTHNFANAWAETQQTVSFKEKQIHADIDTIGTAFGSMFLPLIAAATGPLASALQGLTVWFAGPGQHMFDGIGAGLGRLTSGFQHSSQAPHLLGDAMEAFGPIFTDARKFVDGFVKDHQKQFAEMEATTRQIMGELADLIDAVLKAIAHFWHDYGSEIMQVVKDVFNTIVDIISNALTIVKDVIKLITDIIRGNWSGAWRDVEQLLRDVVGAIFNILGDLVHIVGDSLRLLISRVGDIAGDIVRAFLGLGKDIVMGLWHGIQAAWPTLINNLVPLVGLLPEPLKKVLGIGSPSRVFADLIGKPIAQGIGVGITENIGHPKAALAALAGGLTAGFGSGSGSLLAGAGAGGGTVINFDQRGWQVMSDADMRRISDQVSRDIVRRAMPQAGVQIRR